ncbi:MAG: hypothetical protein QY323_01330 [Patescibacteria group bacterium]|nr:MAG: hypothetical protein QY323_01330 [Patescibacteria group bacterium]
MKKVSFMLSLALLLGAMPAAVGAQGPLLAPGQLVKSVSSSAVYYLDEDLGRQVFPNARIFASWYANFDGVVEVDDATLSEHPLTGNVPYKPAKRLVKLQTDPKVYAVDEGGVLRWLKSEAVARALFGERWNQMVDDLSDAFFVDYTFGADVEHERDFKPERERKSSDLIKTLREKRLSKLRARGASDDAFENDGFGKNKVLVCHKAGGDKAHTIAIARPSLPAHIGHGDTEGRCPHDDDDEDDDDNNDTTTPTITGLSTDSVTTSSARVLLTANESVSAKVYSSTSTPVDTGSSASFVASASSSVTHSINLTGLAASTTYYVRVVVTDGSGNSTTSSEVMFTTLAQPDTTAPTFLTSSVGSIVATSAHLLFTTNENVTAAVYSSTSTPVDTSGTSTVAVTVAASAHDVALTGLSPETTYHAIIIASDAAGNTTASSELTFTTPANN